MKKRRPVQQNAQTNSTSHYFRQRNIRCNQQRSTAWRLISASLSYQRCLKSLYVKTSNPGRTIWGKYSGVYNDIPMICSDNHLYRRQQKNGHTTVVDGHVTILTTVPDLPIVPHHLACKPLIVQRLCP